MSEHPTGFLLDPVRVLYVIRILTERDRLDHACRRCVPDAMSDTFVCLRHELEDWVDRARASSPPPPVSPDKTTTISRASEQSAASGRTGSTRSPQPERSVLTAIRARYERVVMAAADNEIDALNPEHHASWGEVAWLLQYVETGNAALAEVRKALSVAHDADLRTVLLVISELRFELSGPPPRGTEVLCERCANNFCPQGEQLHFHHDGCPACDSNEAAQIDIPACDPITRACDPSGSEATKTGDAWTPDSDGQRMVGNRPPDSHAGTCIEQPATVNAWATKVEGSQGESAQNSSSLLVPPLRVRAEQGVEVNGRLRR